MIAGIAMVAGGVFLGIMLARQTSPEQFKRSTDRARTLVGYAVLGIVALAMLGHLIH